MTFVLDAGIEKWNYQLTNNSRENPLR